MENKEKRKFSYILKENLQKITIFLVSIVYIVQGIFKLEEKETTLLEVIGSVGLSIAVGIVISSSLTSMGLREGRRGELFQASMERYGKVKNEAVPYFDKISGWCEYKNAIDLEERKKEIIQGAGLVWKAFKFGYYEGHQDKLTDKQKKALEEAKTCKILRISSQELLSDLPKMKHHSIFGKESKFGESEQDYRTRDNLVNTITRLGLAVICGLYSLEPLITKENRWEMFAGLIWNTMQIVMWLSLGIIKYVNAKAFIEDEYRQTHIIQKTEYLNEFIITMQKNPTVIEEYDEGKFIDEYIDEYIKKREEKNLDETKQESILD